jgi:hypothetical protein
MSSTTYLEQRLQKCEQDIKLLQGIIQRIDMKDGSVFKNQFSKYYDPTKFYYVCSFGGCGSTPLTKYLSNFGNAFHVHSREPPDKLAYVGKYLSPDPGSHENWFNGVPVKEEDLPNFKVIYLYRDPLKCIYSRFINMNRPDNPERNHIFNIQCPRRYINLKDVVEHRQDLYRLEEFFDNYTRQNPNRNYEIIPLEYNQVFDDFPAFNKLLDLPNDESLFPVKKETKREPYYEPELREVYKSLINKMTQRKDPLS